MIKHIALTACSNPLSEQGQKEMNELIELLKEHHIQVEMEADLTQPFSAKKRADILMKYYRNPDVEMIFDISGGDLANGVLTYLDYETIKENPKPFVGYSDLSVILNGIYAKTGNQGMLYQIRNLIGSDEERQQKEFFDYLEGKSNELCEPEIFMLQGELPEETSIVGGNIRCFLKLAGTSFWPDLNGKILFLESRSGKRELITAFFYQLKQMGVFEHIKGLVLGTFTQLDREEGMYAVEQIVLEVLGEEIPLGRTLEVGHGVDSKGVMIG